MMPSSKVMDARLKYFMDGSFDSLETRTEACSARVAVVPGARVPVLKEPGSSVKAS